MGQKTLHATSDDKHPDATASPSHPKDQPRHRNPGRTPSPTYSTNCESATWNLRNTPDTRFYPTTKCATLRSLPMIDPSWKNGIRNQCKQNKPYALGIDISKEDTLHTLTKSRGKDGTEKPCTPHHNANTRMHPPLHPILRMNQDTETQEEHPHPPIRRIANLQSRIHKITLQTTKTTHPGD